ncbi:MAG TPA: low temperature requirement protein A [Pseudonocardiaceae bacterium]
MASHHQSWIRLRHQLWQPPRHHGEQPRGRVVGPLELFYDLVVVVLVAQAAHHLAAHLTGRGLGEFAAVFTLVWIAWLNGTLHHELHSRDDARGRSTFLLQILVLVPLGAFIPEASSARGSAFATATSVLFALLALLWFLAARGDQPEYRRPSRLFVTGTALCAVVLAASAVLPAGPRVLTWGLTGVAYLAGFTAVIATATPVQAAALTITDALIERFGLLIIIVLGETVTGVVDGLTRTPVNALTLLVALVAVMAGFGAWWTYFDFAGHRPPTPGRPPTLVWMLTHLPLTAAIAAMGAAMVSLTEDAHAARTPIPTAWGLCISTALVLAATALLTTSLHAWHHQPALYRPLSLTCLATSALCLGLGITRPTPLVFGLALVALFGIPWAFAVTHRVTHQLPERRH